MASQPAHADRAHQVVGERRPGRDDEHLGDAAEHNAVQTAPGFEVGVDRLGGSGALLVDGLPLGRSHPPSVVRDRRRIGGLHRPRVDFIGAVLPRRREHLDPSLGRGFDRSEVQIAAVGQMLFGSGFGAPFDLVLHRFKLLAVDPRVGGPHAHDDAAFRIGGELQIV